jgi:MFS family permease
MSGKRPGRLSKMNQQKFGCFFVTAYIIFYYIFAVVAGKLAYEPEIWDSFCFFGKYEGAMKTAWVLAPLTGFVLGSIAWGGAMAQSKNGCLGILLFIFGFGGGHIGVLYGVASATAGAWRFQEWLNLVEKFTFCFLFYVIGPVISAVLSAIVAKGIVTVMKDEA